MCAELEDVGLRPPVYEINAFLLRAIVFNTKFENPAIDGENPAIEHLKEMILKQKYTKRTKENLLRICTLIKPNEVFGAPEIKALLPCTATTSKELMKKFRDMGVVEKVKGAGKGKYRFLYESGKRAGHNL